MLKPESILSADVLTASAKASSPDVLTAQSVSLLRKMVATPSETFSEQAVSDMLYSTLSQWGLDIHRCGLNLYALNQHFDSSKPTLVLDAHIDTVPACSSYTRDPLDPGNDPDIVWGLGSNDDGGSVVAMIAVFRHFHEADLPINLVLNLVVEEERCGDRGECLMFSQDGPAPVREARWVIVGEPTLMRAATSERGLLVLDGFAEGVSGHAARSEGVNALYIALDDIAALRAHKFERSSSLMGEVRLNVTQITAGSAHNVVPDKCNFVVDVRPTDVYDNQELLQELQALCRSRLIPRNLKNRSSATPSSSLLLRAVDELGIEKFSSPTTSNWIKLPCEAIKMGPGGCARSHRADEFIRVKEIEDAVIIYKKFIEKLYGYFME